MQLITQFIDYFLNLDKHLAELVSEYGTWTYSILFLIVFCETGLVVTPLLPGDSLLFAAGAIAALGDLNVWFLIGILLVAAILGDTVNYHIGKAIGPKVFTQKDSRFLKQEYLRKTEKFYQKHGGKTIIIARFVPIVRTFAPFVAGVGTMDYRQFIKYNIAGAFLWVFSLVLAGYWFGQLPIVKENFGLVVVAIIIISVMPMVIEFIKAKRESILEQKTLKTL